MSPRSPVGRPLLVPPYASAEIAWSRPHKAELLRLGSTL